MKDLDVQLARFVGQEAEPPRVARYAVNEAMIRNWVEAHDDFNPIYVERDAARATGRSDIVCPPAMISTWVMQGYRRWRQVQKLRGTGREEQHAYSRLLALLDEHGFTSVVATSQEQEYVSELHPGDQVSCHFTIESISPFKRTALGLGCFITLDKRYVNQSGAPLVNERFVILRFDPNSKEPSA